MTETSGPSRHDPDVPAARGTDGAAVRAAGTSGWKTLAQTALIVAAVLLVQRVVLPWLGVGT